MQVLLTSIFLALRLVLPGVAWAWCFPRVDGDRSRAGQALVNAARILVGGVAVNALLVMVLAETGHFSTVPDLVAWAGLSLAGLALGWLRRRAVLTRCLMDGMLVLPAVAAWFAVALALPDRGEWLAGGWDPGVYQQQGVHVARTGTFHPEPVPVYADMSTDEFTFFTRGSSSYREAFPGIPLDRRTRGYHHYFFRLTPSFTALLYHVGGLEAALRINLILAPIAVLGLAAVLFGLASSWSLAGFAALLLAVNPVFVYHTHLPTSEMLHLVLVCGVGLSLRGRSRRGEGLVVLGGFLALSVLNRFAFLPFAGMLVAAMAWLDLRRPDRGRCAFEHGIVILFVAAAVLFNHLACSITLVRLHRVRPILVGVFLVAVAVVALLDVLGIRERLRERLETWIAATLRWGFLVLVMCGGLLAVWSLSGGAMGHLEQSEGVAGKVRSMGDLAAGLAAFLGYVSVAGAIAGGVLVFRRKHALPRELLAWCVFGSVATAILVFRPSIWGIFPWVLRRFVPYTLPLVATLNAFWLSRLWQNGLPRLGRLSGPVLACCGATVLVAVPAGRAARAWAVTEYNGITGALEEVSRQTEAGDVVVVDSRRWCAPLALVHDLQVLNGERLWYRQDAEGMRKGLGILRRLRDQGYRIRFLTTTGDGLEVYPEAPNARLDWKGSPYRYHTVIHSARARDFALEEGEALFELSTWTPDRDPSPVDLPQE